jgi:hypothetical protein
MRGLTSLVHDVDTSTGASSSTGASGLRLLDLSGLLGGFLGSTGVLYATGTMCHLIERRKIKKCSLNLF